MGFPCFYSRNKKRYENKIITNKDSDNKKINNINKINNQNIYNNKQISNSINKKKKNIEDFDEEISNFFLLNKNYEELYENSKNIKDDNLEMTNYFNNYNNNSIEEYQKNELYENYQKIMNKINNNNILNTNRKLNAASQKIENEFGFSKEIQNNFSKTKNYLNLCSNLTLEDEQLIKKISFSDFINNEDKHKKIFKEIISKNKDEIINFINNSK